VHNTTHPSGRWQQKIEDHLAHVWVQNSLIGLIFVNALILGFETSPEITLAYGDTLALLDHSILAIFVLEIALLIFARGWRYFRDPWCVFDFLVVGISLVPTSTGSSVFRSLRVLRMLRFINKVESIKKVASGLVSAIPGLGAVVGLMLILYYVTSVFATNEFGRDYPELFGNLGLSFFTLFQIMTLDGWSDSVARPVMQQFPYSWIFFVVFILFATFIVVNLFLAVIEESLISESEDNKLIKSLHVHIAKLEEKLEQQNEVLVELKEFLHKQE
jgi:voltage-gated sodium channel